MPISFPHLFLKYTSICGIFLFCVIGTCARGYAQPPITTLEGEQLGDIAWEDARAFTVVTRSTLNRLKATDEGVPPDLQTLSDAAFAAFEKKDNYRAYRLFIRFMAMTRDSSSGEGTELAASYNLVLNRTITNTGDTLHVQLKPLFTLGRPLSGKYTARLSLRGTKGVVDERTLPISSVRAFDCALSTADLPEGRAGVRYELRDPAGKLLLRVTRAFLHTDTMSSRLKILQTQLKTLQDENIAARGATHRAALETIEYIVGHLEEMHAKYVGDLRRTAQPMVMKYRGGGRGLTWRGAINIPADIDLAETLSLALLEGKDPLKKSTGDFHLAYRSAVDSQLVPYRLFVPEGYTPDQSWPLIIGLHGASGSENTWMDRRRRGETENLCKRLSQERGYLLVCAEWTRTFHRVSRDWRARCHGCIGSRIVHLQYRSRARVPHRSFDGRRRHLDFGIETRRKICRHRANRGQRAVGKIETRQTACRSSRAIFTRGKGHGRAGRTRTTHRKTAGKIYEKFYLYRISRRYAQHDMVHSPAVYFRFF